jgi:hypothetical protein
MLAKILRRINLFCGVRAVIFKPKPNPNSLRRELLRYFCAGSGTLHKG